MINTENENISVRSTEIEKGATIKVRTYSGDVVERIVWEVSDDAVFVCTGRVYADLQNGLEAPLPVGFQIADIVPG